MSVQYRIQFLDSSADIIRELAQALKASRGAIKLIVDAD